MKSMLITSKQHELVKHLVRLRTQKSYRRQTSHCLVMGRKMLQELLVKNLVVTILANKDIPLHFGDTTAKIYLTTEEILKKVSNLTNPEPVVAEVKMPVQNLAKIKQGIVICDRIQDPGNLGTIIRSSHALNADAIMLLENCVDPFNDKALRAAKGSTFHLPIIEGNLKQLLDMQKQYALKFYHGDLQGQLLQNVAICKPYGLILSNESKGVSESLKSLSKGVKIPMSSHVDSMNVAIAGSILLYIFRGNHV